MAKYTLVEKKKYVDEVRSSGNRKGVAKKYNVTVNALKNWEEQFYGENPLELVTKQVVQKNINTGNPVVKKILDIRDERFATELHNGIENIPKDLKDGYQEIRELFAELFTQFSANMERYYVYTWREVVIKANNPVVDERMARFILSDPQVKEALNDEYRDELKQQVDSMTYSIAEGDFNSADIQALKQIATILESTQKYESTDNEIVVMQIPTKEWHVCFENMLNAIGVIYRWADRNEVPQITAAIERLKDDTYIKNNKLMMEIRHGDKPEPYVGHAGNLEEIWENGDVTRE